MGLNKMLLSEYIIGRLKVTGTSKYSLAGQIGVTRKMVYRYINGECFPSPYLLEKLFDALGGDHSSISSFASA